VRKVVPPLSGPRPGRHREGLLYETHLYFPTGSSHLDEPARTTLTDLVARMAAFSRAHPHARYAISIEAHASRRWRGAAGDQRRAGGLDDRLSEARANEAAAAIGRAFLDANPDPSASHIDVVIGGQPRGMGAFNAIQRGATPEDDEWRDRRLDVLIYFREAEPGAEVAEALDG
jgi:outer membrane protein OmpA-like peptidoglycan-associated protein